MDGTLSSSGPGQYTSGFKGTLSHTSTTYTKSVINNSGAVSIGVYNSGIKITGGYRGIYNTGTITLEGGVDITSTTSNAIYNSGTITKTNGPGVNISSTSSEPCILNTGGSLELMQTGITVKSTNGQAIYLEGGTLKFGQAVAQPVSSPSVHSTADYAINMGTNAEAYIYSGCVISDAKEAIYGRGILQIGNENYIGSQFPYIQTNNSNYSSINTYGFAQYQTKFTMYGGRLYSERTAGPVGCSGPTPKIPSGWSIKTNTSPRYNYLSQ